MKVSELTGAKLDYWVGQAIGKTHVFISFKFDACWDNELTDDNDCTDGIWSPSTNWAIGGPIIDREDISFWKEQRWDDGVLGPVQVFAGYNLTGFHGQLCYASPAGLVAEHEQSGATKLEAAMRCFVASKYGDEVPGE